MYIIAWKVVKMFKVSIYELNTHCVRVCVDSTLWKKVNIFAFIATAIAAAAAAVFKK